MAFDLFTNPRKSNLLDLGLSPKRKPSVKTVNLGKDSCMICGKKKAQVGRLERAHILAKSKGGKVTVLLCPKHHIEYDSGKLSSSQLSKIGVSRSRYGKYRPKAPRAKPRKYDDPLGIRFDTKALQW